MSRHSVPPPRHREEPRPTPALRRGSEVEQARRIVRRNGDDDRGSVVEAVLVVPVLMLLLLIVVQFALWSHAAQVAQLAASEGDRTARSLGSSPTLGVDRALSVLAGPGSDVASPAAASVMLPGNVVEVKVTGHADSILPWLSLPVSAKLVGPIQEFRGSE
ncbi:MAG: TadE/TadG family type IV pilus assembly protein [Acidimicrobiales bacterium]